MYYNNHSNINYRSNILDRITIEVRYYVSYSTYML